MELLKIKLKKSASAMLLMLTIFISLFSVMCVANAHTPPYLDVPTHCYAAVSSETIGISQEVLFVFWLDWVPPTSTGAMGDRWNFYLDLTTPNGKNETLGPYKSDSVGGSYIAYTPDQLGTYSFVARFPGQKLTGIPGAENNINVNDTYAPSTSAPVYLYVQEEPIYRYKESPLPDSYWTRPIYDTNRNWGAYAMGQWLGGAYYESLREKGIKNQAGPESSHILWTRSYTTGGVMGGPTEDQGYYTGIAYEGFSSPMLVLDGKAYYSIRYPPWYGWYCIDLYTGETIYYENNTIGNTGMPAFGEVLNYNSPNQHGGFSYLWRTSGVTLPTGTTTNTGTQVWEMLNSFTGDSICKIANVSTSGTQFIDSMGGICYLNFANLGTASSPNYYMQIWNSTEAVWWRPSYGVVPPKTLLNGTTNLPVTTTSNDYWMWRPGATAVSMSTTQAGAIYDGQNGYSMNVSVTSILGPSNSVLNQTGTIQELIPDQHVIVGAGGRNDERGVVPGFLRAYSLKQGEWGKILWDLSFTPPKATDAYLNSTYSGDSGGPVLSRVSSEDGIFTYREKVSGAIFAYSLTTAKQIWAITEDIQWYYYGLSASIHNGRVYTYGPGTALTAYNATTGAFLWNWSAPSMGYLESATTYPPLTLAFFVDETGREKVYFYSTEGTGLVSPVRRDGSIFCLDTNSGDLLWRLTCWPAYGNQRLGLPVISDSRILVLDVHDNQIYCIGKGLSATTVSAPQTVPALGNSITITGTVTDQSPSGRHDINGNLDLALKGTPAISDQDMDAWMEYMFHQRPKPTNAKGVEVFLNAIDPNGNYITIGNTTSDSYGNYGLAFTPDIPGTYQIIAMFKGSAAYGPSDATAYLTIGDEAPTQPPTQIQQTSIADTYFIPGIIAVILTVIIVGIALALMLKKRP
ncbi:hypothetical protein [Candidatus Bathycorpusculum sp.]|uniref:hypothetical protein n=1 Tax=Candidatus Bathycorpusculum sp. TaxID=2994959 RepID=UPI00282F3F4A|nr:hypothetical protein [Candidatus Termitimicrobium sp.]